SSTSAIYTLSLHDALPISGLDAVLEWIRPEVSRLVGFDLAPTFSYTRQYAKGEVLARHRDRAACEISVTVSIQIPKGAGPSVVRSEEHTSELQSRFDLVCR